MQYKFLASLILFCACNANATSTLPPDLPRLDRPEPPIITQNLQTNISFTDKIKSAFSKVLYFFNGNSTKVKIEDTKQIPPHSSQLADDSSTKLPSTQSDDKEAQFLDLGNMKLPQITHNLDDEPIKIPSLAEDDLENMSSKTQDVVNDNIVKSEKSAVGAEGSKLVSDVKETEATSTKPATERRVLGAMDEEKRSTLAASDGSNPGGAAQLPAGIESQEKSIAATNDHKPIAPENQESVEVKIPLLPKLATDIQQNQEKDQVNIPKMPDISNKDSENTEAAPAINVVETVPKLGVSEPSAPVVQQGPNDNISLPKTNELVKSEEPGIKTETVRPVTDIVVNGPDQTKPAAIVAEAQSADKITSIPQQKTKAQDKALNEDEPAPIFVAPVKTDIPAPVMQSPQVAVVEPKNIDKIPEVQAPNVEIVKFQHDEVQMLLLPADDVVLGQLTFAALLDQMEPSAYIRYIEKQKLARKDDPKKDKLHSFIANYENNFHRNINYHSSAVLEAAFQEASNAIFSNDISSVRILIDNYEILQKSAADGTLLHKAVAADNYQLAKLLLMRGINVSVIDKNNHTAMAMARQLKARDVEYLLKQAAVTK